MRLLLDTHILIWLAEGHKKLPVKSRQRIDRVAADQGLAVCAISFWEAAMLCSKGRISLAHPIAEWRRAVLAAPGIIEIPVLGDIGIEAVNLPPGLHEDPADRLLVATARIHNLVLGTRDHRLLEYAQIGHVAAERL
ncbi:MAG: type II toxin-antitoxin system VapC family toxin [Deltaproteobacteria bacterium]|nr:type II toxin-antitoxin system VapC family toxin [Deltaproteobacteria bacterium]